MGRRPPLLDRVRSDIAAGRTWKARDRLVGALAARADEELLDQLGELHAGAGDLPSAGAAWFGTSREGSEVDAALAAWRERHGDDPEHLWRSLPRGVQHDPVSARAQELGRRVAPRRRRAGPGAWSDADPRTTWGERLGVLGCALIVLMTVVVFGVGAWTVAGWLL